MSARSESQQFRDGWQSCRDELARCGGCPQCWASDRIRVLDKSPWKRSPSQEGERAAAAEFLIKPHRCGLPLGFRS